MASPTLLTVPAVIDELDISIDTWKKWRTRRVGPPARRLPNGQLRIRRTDLDDWLDDLEAT